MENNSLEVAKTIHSQLIGLGKIKVWSWGSNSWTAINQGLSFKVQGLKFTGRVNIILMPSDTYTIQFIKSDVVEKEFADVYFDEQVDIIDNYVEFTGAKYNEDVQKALYKF